MKRFKTLTQVFFEKMERQASIEGAPHLKGPLSWKVVRLLAWAVGIAVVILAAIVMEHYR